MPKPKQKGWIKWRSCPARAVILDDLLPGGLLYQRDYITAEELFPWYKQFPEFKDVILDQFKAWLADHRRKAQWENHKAIQQEQYFIHDREKYPQKTHNERGEINFDTHPAKLLLREDLKEGGLANTRFKNAGELQASRDEYKVFERKRFRDRVRQEEKRNKYFNYKAFKKQQEREGEKKGKKRMPGETWVESDGEESDDEDNDEEASSDNNEEDDEDDDQMDVDE